MRVIVLLLSSIVFVVTAQAQSFNSLTLTPVLGGFNGPGLSGPTRPTDLVLLDRDARTGGLPLSAFASALDVQNLNSRIDQAFQQLNGGVSSSTTQLERGIAAAVALSGVSMPSAPGRTTWAINGAAFQSELGAGVSLAHRLPTSMPIALTAAYGNGGGTAHVGRVGLIGEF